MVVIAYIAPNYKSKTPSNIELPGWAIALIAVAGVLIFVCGCAFYIMHMQHIYGDPEETWTQGNSVHRKFYTNICKLWMI